MMQKLNHHDNVLIQHIISSAMPSHWHSTADIVAHLASCLLPHEETTHQLHFASSSW
jgi:hypothetical protein